MKAVAQLLNALQSGGLVQGYALIDAMAQMHYTEPVATHDAEVLVAVSQPDRLDVLGDIYAFCATRGYLPEGEAIRVGAWPVQFVQVISPLTREAMELAETADFDGVPLRVMGAAHLAVIALSVGRAKDLARAPALLESGSVTGDELERLATRNGLAADWERFEGRFPVSDVERSLERQAHWQRTRLALTWPEKVRMAEQVRESILQLRRSGQGGAAPSPSEHTGSHPGRPGTSAGSKPS